MAAIALQDGKVVLKDGKVSCSCCDECDENFLITDQNVFEITKAEYDGYRNGGNWSIESSWNQYENYSEDFGSATAVGSGYGIVSGFASGCYHSGFGTMETSTTYSFTPEEGDPYSFTQEGQAQFGISLSLKKYDGKYYARYTAFSVVSSSIVESSPSGYPAYVDLRPPLVMDAPKFDL
jgi:hypothetical protein